MPLEKSASKSAVGRNIKAEMGAGKPQRQAIAIALDVQRRSRKGGGVAGLGPMPGLGGLSGVAGVRGPHKQQRGHVGAIPSSVPGRTDRHPISVPKGAYVLPAEHVSSLGQGNTLAGMKALNGMFPHTEKGLGFASGGAVDELIPIMAAGGEYVIHPQDVSAIGGGDMDKGHKELDKWVMLRRKNHIATLKDLPPPAKD